MRHSNSGGGSLPFFSSSSPIRMVFHKRNREEMFYGGRVYPVTDVASVFCSLTKHPQRDVETHLRELQLGEGFTIEFGKCGEAGVVSFLDALDFFSTNT